jgi:hypothetical protein
MLRYLEEDAIEMSKLSIYDVPQLRILARKINSENGFHVVASSKTPEDSFPGLADEVQDLILAALAGPHLFSEPGKSAE